MCKTSNITIRIDKTIDRLDKFDLLYVPGSTVVCSLKQDETFINWLRTGKEVTYKFSACTGSLLLGEAGFLIDKKATTHYKHLSSLTPYCKVVSNEKIVEDGNVVTVGGVTFSIDLGYILRRNFSEKV
ncbi:DJ-1/PfpI family protein [Jeotgalibacillus proteolyticus]|uniref:DJ-1/PfpI family protein n=1 Tax=Jeotgalibacillus proteolyticus TaxID=2082395 RepID=UPI0024683433|nr:DJ-1/PfpI family protein [Jeotgalibacillus proteolyticus]